MRFAVDADPLHELARASEIRSRYQLPERYFYLPNQFWAHKNHVLAVDALAEIKKNSGLDALPPIIMTGRTEDPRNPGIFESLKARAEAAGVASHFRYLGLIPYADVFGLNAGADALINPSRFEGWSTPVEEAKALGTRMLLSGIPLHREQAPDALFFDPDSPQSLVSAMMEVTQSGPFQRKPAAELAAAHLKRRRDYAEDLLLAFKAAIALKAS